MTYKDESVKKGQEFILVLLMSIAKNRNIIFSIFFSFLILLSPPLKGLIASFGMALVSIVLSNFLVNIDLPSSNDKENEFPLFLRDPNLEFGVLFIYTIIPTIIVGGYSAKIFTRYSLGEVFYGLLSQ